MIGTTERRRPAPGPATCDYCHLDLPAGPRPSDEPAYCCFGCRLAAEITHERGQQGALQWTMVRLGLAIFLSINVMMFTMVLWTSELYDARASGAGPLAASLADLFRYLCLVLSLPVLLLLGGPLWDNALRLRRGDAAAADLLILLGVAASYVYSVISVLRGAGHVYFEIGCAVLVMVTFGRWLEASGKLKTTAALDALERLLPEDVRRLDARGVETETPLAEICSGDRLRVLAGERIAVDGQIERGCGAIDQQILTGESRPATLGVGQQVLGGSLNLDGDLIVRATADPRSGTLARLVELVRAARERKGHYQRLSERVSRWFLRGVIAVALATFAWHAWNRGIDEGVLNALAVLLIACPCAGSGHAHGGLDGAGHRGPFGRRRSRRRSARAAGRDPCRAVRQDRHAYQLRSPASRALTSSRTTSARRCCAARWFWRALRIIWRPKRSPSSSELARTAKRPQGTTDQSQS